MSFAHKQFILPDISATCPLEGATNPHYDQGAAESRTWINSYDIFRDRKRAFFVLGSNELLCSRVYAYAGCDQFRTSCDFVRTSIFNSLGVGLIDISGKPSLRR
jgi:hypothetical protein